MGSTFTLYLAKRPATPGCTYASPIGIVHIVLWKLKQPGLLTKLSKEEGLTAAKEAISALMAVVSYYLLSASPY